MRPIVEIPSFQRSRANRTMERCSTIFLRIVISLLAIAALAVCVFPLPRGIAYEAAKTPDTAWQIYVFLVGAYIQAALFFFRAVSGVQVVKLHRQEQGFLGVIRQSFAAY